MASLYEQMTGTPNYDDILNSNLSREQKAQAIRERGAAYDKSVDREKNKKLAKLYAGAALEIGSAAIPIGGGARLAGSVAKALAPRVGRKIAQEVGTGLVGGALSGGVFGTGRGLMEDKNPLVTAAQDALVGSALGGGIGYGAGQIGKKIAYNNLFKTNTTDVNGLASFLKPRNDAKIANYFDNYVEGLTNGTVIGSRGLLSKELDKVRAAQQGIRPKGQMKTSAPEFDIIADENGNPISFYHGTPNAGYTEFKIPSHFSKNRNYADTYQNMGASSIQVKQTANNPGTYEVNLDVNKMFDTRNPIDKNIFKNEYQAYYSPELTDKGMVDWMEAEDLMDWLKEKHPEYDALVVDEGGVPNGLLGSGEYIDRGESYLPFNSDQILIKNLDAEKPIDLFEEIIKKDNWHKKQSNLIQKTNPAQDDYHTWIRSSKDIKTPDEVFNVNKFEGTPDFKFSDAVKARKDGFIKVYSSKPINEGGFVTPSKMDAQSYAGNNGEVYEAIVPLKDVAWIDSTQGQYAPITHKEYGLSNEPLQFTGKSVIMDGETYRQLKVGDEEYSRLLKEFNKSLSPEEKASKQFAKPINNSNYYIVNNGFNEPMLTWKELLK